VTVPAAIDARYEGGDELALTGRQRRGPRTSGAARKGATSPADQHRYAASRPRSHSREGIEAARTVPIIFVNVTDPVGQGFVENLARPGGNAPGFTLFEFSMGTRWLEILRELVPSVKKVGFMFNPAMAPYSGLYLRSIQQAAPTFGIEPHSMPVDDEAA